jgi:hypothetical protein
MKRILLISALMVGSTAAFAQAHSQPMQPASGPVAQPTAQMAPASTVVGQVQPGQPGEHRVFRIPPAIEAACQDKPVGTKVDVTFRSGKTRTVECGVHPHFHHPHFPPASEAGASAPAQAVPVTPVSQ